MSAKRVLVVDDEAHLREIAQMSLEAMAGWRVTVAASGEEAIAAAGADPPDAILLDLMLPGLDGAETFRRLRRHAATAQVPVVLLTAKLQPADRAHFEGLGVDGVIGKPFEPMALARQVANLLGWDR
ncbi:response regulator [Aquisalimonas sp.]|uniref:response regulator n=1 Tax=Aquisalimonas sp. TaxID=1872621 RepID=UPI0025BD875B|nr:response regulator [Aquisalimonas sp.]